MYNSLAPTPCKFFTRTGRCFAGADCKYAHVPKSTPRATAQSTATVSAPTALASAATRSQLLPAARSFVLASAIAAPEFKPSAVPAPAVAATAPEPEPVFNNEENQQPHDDDQSQAQAQAKELDPKPVPDYSFAPDGSLTILHERMLNSSAASPQSAGQSELIDLHAMQQAQQQQLNRQRDSSSTRRRPIAQPRHLLKSHDSLYMSASLAQRFAIQQAEALSRTTPQQQAQHQLPQRLLNGRYHVLNTLESEEVRLTSESQLAAWHQFSELVAPHVLEAQAQYKSQQRTVQLLKVRDSHTDELRVAKRFSPMRHQTQQQQQPHRSDDSSDFNLSAAHRWQALQQKFDPQQESQEGHASIVALRSVHLVKEFQTHRPVTNPAIQNSQHASQNFGAKQAAPSASAIEPSSPSLLLVSDYYPCSASLAFAIAQQDSCEPMAESLLFSYVAQILSLLAAVHRESSSLDAALTAHNILIVEPRRMRIANVGALKCLSSPQAPSIDVTADACDDSPIRVRERQELDLLQLACIISSIQGRTPSDQAVPESIQRSVNQASTRQEEIEYAALESARSRLSPAMHAAMRTTMRRSSSEMRRLIATLIQPSQDENSKHPSPSPRTSAHNQHRTNGSITANTVDQRQELQDTFAIGADLIPNSPLPIDRVLTCFAPRLIRELSLALSHATQVENQLRREFNNGKFFRLLVEIEFAQYHALAASGTKTTQPLADNCNWSHRDGRRVTSSCCSGVASQIESGLSSPVHGLLNGTATSRLESVSSSGAVAFAFAFPSLDQASFGPKMTTKGNAQSPVRMPLVECDTDAIAKAQQNSTSDEAIVKLFHHRLFRKTMTSSSSNSTVKSFACGSSPRTPIDSAVVPQVDLFWTRRELARLEAASDELCLLCGPTEQASSDRATNNTPRTIATYKQIQEAITRCTLKQANTQREAAAAAAGRLVMPRRHNNQSKAVIHSTDHPRLASARTKAKHQPSKLANLAKLATTYIDQ